MKTILLAWELGGGLGHLMRLRPLADALLEAGHRVVLLARHRSAKEVFAELADRYPSLRIGPAPVLKTRSAGEPDPKTTYTLADVLAAQGSTTLRPCSARPTAGIAWSTASSPTSSFPTSARRLAWWRGVGRRSS